MKRILNAIAWCVAVPVSVALSLPFLVKAIFVSALGHAQIFWLAKVCPRVTRLTGIQPVCPSNDEAWRQLPGEQYRAMREFNDPNACLSNYDRVRQGKCQERAKLLLMSQHFRVMQVEEDEAS